MAIDYVTVIDPLYATDVVTDAAYSAVDAANRDQTSEQRILTTVEILRAHMALLRSDEEARLFHYCVARMLAGVAYNYIYDDLVASVSGNVTVNGTTFANGDTVDVTTASGTDNVVLAGAPFTDLDAVVTDINGLIATATEVEAFNDGGKLGFRNTTGNDGVPFTLAIGAGPSVLNKAGISAGDFYSKVERVANAARDEAVAHFERVGRPEAADL